MAPARLQPPKPRCCGRVKMTGLSRAQITRLIQQYRQGGELQPARYRRHRCPQVHARRRRTAGGGGRGPRNPQRPGHAQDPRAGIPAVPAARIRAAGGDLGGPDLSPAAAQSLPPAAAATKTRPTAVSIGERRRPDPQGQPGFLRVDTVHQGDREASRASTTSMPWMKSPSGLVGATPAISEAWLEPLLKAMIEQFPFRIRGFHSDRQRVPQSHGGEAIEQAADRTDRRGTPTTTAWWNRKTAR